MPPPPLRTCASTVSSSGLRSSRFGPVVPSEPAAASVWQVPQLLAKTAAPSAPPSVVSAVVAAVVAAPPESSSSSPPQPAAATTSSASTTAMIHTRDRILASFYGGSRTLVSLPRACSVYGAGRVSRRRHLGGSADTSRFPGANCGNAVGVHTLAKETKWHHRVHHPGPLGRLDRQGAPPGRRPRRAHHHHLGRRGRRNPGRIPRRRAFRRRSDG